MKRSLNVCLLSLLLGLCIGLPNSLAAQVEVGDYYPTKRIKGDWYLDTLHHVGWQRIGNRWKGRDVGRCEEMVGCGKYAVLKFDGLYKLYSRKGELRDNLKGYYCADTAIWLWNNLSLSVYNEKGYFKLPINQNCMIAVADQPILHTVQGIKAFCLVPRGLTSEPKGIADLANWGMLGVNGKWLIAPKFDKPFRFVNGVAEVIFDGQRRKINEKGEFVE